MKGMGQGVFRRIEKFFETAVVYVHLNARRDLLCRLTRTLR